MLSRLSRVGCLVLDDLGKESPTDWTLGQVFRVVNDRYENMRPVVVTTQYGKSDLIRRLAKNGDEETAVAIVSRLSEMCDKYELQGKDRSYRMANVDTLPEILRPLMEGPSIETPRCAVCGARGRSTATTS